MAIVELTAPFAGLSGKVGKLGFARTKYGTVMRELPERNDPKTLAQQAVRSHITQVSQHYRNLTPEQRKTWKAYLELLEEANPQSKRRNVYLVYTGLACKYLQMHPNDAPPANGPAALFFGDGIAIQAAGKPGGIRFTATAANAPDVVTEILLQPLKHTGRTPIFDRYRSQAFVHFEAGSLEFVLEVSPGAYAAAYRFVNSATGQEAGIAPLPPVFVGN